LSIEASVGLRGGTILHQPGRRTDERPAGSIPQAVPERAPGV